MAEQLSCICDAAPLSCMAHGHDVPRPDSEKAAPLFNQCEDCGDATDADPCPGCKKLVCQSCAEAEGEFCRCIPPLPPPEPPPLPPGCVATKIGESVLDGPAAPAVAEGWRIRDLDELNRVLGRMARLQRLRGENERVVAAEVNRLGEWLEKEDQALEKRYRDLEAHVYEFARDNREALGKTRRLPNGTVAWKEREKGAYRWRQDMTPKEREAALLKWAKDMQPHVEGTPLTVPGPEKPNLEEIKNLLSFITGDSGGPAQADGLEWVGPGESLSIVVGGKKP